MKKRLLSAILAFILILGAVPAVAAETTSADPTAEVAAAPRAPKELAPTSASVPKISGITPTATGLKIQWSAYPGAAKYYLYLKKDNKWKTLAVTTAAAYEHKSLTSNTIYTYTVRAADKNGKLISGYDRNGSSKRFLSTPTLVRCESTTTGQKVIWKPVTGAVAYRVYIKSGKNWIVAGTTSGTYCINTRVTSGKAYAYTVRCWDKTAGAPLSYYNTKGIMGVYVATPQITSFNAINGGVTLKWSQCNGAKYYGVFRKYSTGWKRIATTTKPTYSDTTIRYSARYTYTVRCLDANRKYNSGYNSNGWSFTHLEPPQLTSVTYRDQKYTLTWGSQKTASKYGVYRKKLGGKWQVVGRPKTNTFTDTTADKDGIYTYAVRTLDAAGNFLTYCPKLTTITVADGNTNNYISVDNVLIHNHNDGNSYIALCAPGKTGEYEMSAEGLTGNYVWILGGSFASCEGLTGITLAPNLRYILCEDLGTEEDYHDLAKGADFDVEYNTIALDSYDDLNEKEFKADLDEVVGSGTFVQFLDRENNVGVRALQEEIEQHNMFSGIFPIIFVLVALLTLLTTMSRLISSQRIQIGTLKAMGYSNKSIIYHYLSYGFFLSLAGAILGFIIGPLTIPQLFYPSMSAMYSLPYWGPAWDLSFFAVAALMVIFSVLVTFLSVKSISDENPADSIKPKAPKLVSSGFVEKTKIWQRLSFNERWNYRDAKRNKVRAFMSIFGVFACALLLISAFGMYDSMGDVKDWQYDQIYHYNSKLFLNENITDSQLDNILDETNGEEMMEETIEMKYKGNKNTGTLTVYNESELYKTTDINRNYITLDPNGIAISNKMAEVLNIKVGDKVRWHVVGNPKWIDSEITETYAIPFGQGMIMSPKVFEREGGDDYNYSTNVILTKENVKKNYTGVDSISTREDTISGWNSITEAMDLMVTVLITFAVLLAVVVLYNLGLLSFTEIQRELATMKVLGFNSKSLRRLLLTQNIWFSTIGFIFAIPGAYLLMMVMMGSTGEDYYFPINIYLWNLVLSFIITFGLSVLVNLMFSRKIKRVNMVESLKSNE